MTTARIYPSTLFNTKYGWLVGEAHSLTGVALRTSREGDDERVLKHLKLYGVAYRLNLRLRFCEDIRNLGGDPEWRPMSDALTRAIYKRSKYAEDGSQAARREVTNNLLPMLLGWATSESGTEARRKAELDSGLEDLIVIRRRIADLEEWLDEAKLVEQNLSLGIAVPSNLRDPIKATLRRHRTDH